MPPTIRLLLRCVALVALLATQMGNAGGRAAVGGHGATGAPGENGALCAGCHNGGLYGPILELLQITDGDGQIIATYTPGATYDLRFTVLENAGNPAGFGFQLTALDGNNKPVGSFKNLGANVKQSLAQNTANRPYLEHKGGKSATGVFKAKWVAPAAKTGDVKFYYAGVVVNGNNAKTGDNGSLGSSITLTEGTPNGLPRLYFDDFEIGDGGFHGYPGVGSLAPSSWAHGAPQGNIISGAASGANAWVTNLGGNHSDGERSYLESPAMDLSLATADPVISFAIQYDTEAGLGCAWLEISTDAGISWNKLGSLGSGVSWYSAIGPHGDCWSGDSSGWLYASHPLTGAAGHTDVRIRFALATDGAIAYEGLAIDDLAILDQSDPPDPEPPPPDPDPTEPPPPDPEPLPPPPDPEPLPPPPDPEPLPPPDPDPEPLPPPDPDPEPLPPLP